MEELLDAYEFLDKRYPDFESLDNGSIWDNIEEVMREFAKLHVEAALKEASKKGKCSNGTSVILKDSILNAYPLSNIK